MGPGKHVRPVNALTVDLEDWYQGTRIDVREWSRFEDRIEPPTYRLLELLADANVQATFFVLGYAAEHHPELVRTIEASGHEVATHGYQHQPYYECTRAQVRADLRRSIGILEDLTGRSVIGHRAPFFSITRSSWWALEVLAELGLRYDSSVFPIRHWRCGVHDAVRWPHSIETATGTLFEFPPSTWRIFRLNLPFAGGAYLRAWPYAATHLAIQRINAQGQPAVVYVHPWELDPQRPRTQTDWSMTIAQHLNDGSTLPRLSSLLRDFHFVPMRDLLPHGSHERSGWSGSLESTLLSRTKMRQKHELGH